MVWGASSRRASQELERGRQRQAERAEAAAASFSSSAGQRSPVARATLADFEGSYAKPQSHVSQVQRQLQQAAENGNSSATKLQQGIMQKRHSFAPGTAPSSITSPHITRQGRHDAIDGLLAAKEATGKSFTDLGLELGLTNTYCAQLFFNQAQLQPGRVAALRKAVPQLTDQQVAFMQRSPLRLPEPEFVQEPSHRVLQEALAYHAAAIKAVMNENWGDVVLSPADIAAEVSLTPGKDGQPRFTLTLSGKYTQFVEQETFVPNGVSQVHSAGRRAQNLPSMPEE